MNANLFGIVLLLAVAWPSVSASAGEPAFEVLPCGRVTADGWLLRQLERQRDGLTGYAEELYDDIGRSDWLTGAGKCGQHDWERGPYYAKRASKRWA